MANRYTVDRTRRTRIDISSIIQSVREFSGVTLGMGAPLLAPPSTIWRPLSPQEAVLLYVPFKIKSRQNSENDGENLKKCASLA